MDPIQVNGPAPYAPTKSVTEILERQRQGPGLPKPLTTESIQRLGVTESLAPRVIQALRLLGLIDEAGNVTETFEELRKVPTPEYKPRLLEVLRDVYAEVFSVVDPSTAEYQQIHDAFRSFTPHGQIDRMVTLFLGLLEYSEFGPLPRARSSTSQAAGRTTPKTGRTRTRSARAGAVDAPPRSAPTPTAEGRSPVNQDSAGHSLTVDLGTAGHVTLLVDVNPLRLSAKDREFLFGLVDSMEARRSATVPATLDSVTGSSEEVSHEEG